MKRTLSGLLFFLASYHSVYSQCTPATVRGSSNINTPGHPLNSAFNSSTTANGVINNLSSGMFSFTGSVTGGTATWGAGIQLRNDATVGNYIYVQPNNTNSVTTTKVATYTIQFAETVTNFSLRCAGLNYNDQLRITAFNGATPITLTAANFTDNVPDPGHTGTIAITNGSTLTSTNTAGGTEVTTNRITLNIPGPVTRIVMVSGKSDNSTSTVTLGFTSVGYTRCVKVPADINATFVNTAITGDVSTNDLKPTGTTYGTATALPGNPGPAVPVVSSNGTYSFTSAVPGVFKFTVPMCPGSAVVPDCANVDLTITVSNASINTNKPFANTDLATTPINTPVTLSTLANDKAGNNFSFALNPASVSVTAAPLHGTTSINSSTGAITFTPTTGYTGYDTLTYQVCDVATPTPQCASAYQIITIIPASSENSTVAADDYNSATLNKTAAGNVLTNDSDPQANTQTVTAQTTTVPTKGTLTLGTDGAYSFVPVSGFSGAVNFPYQVCDNGTPSVCTNATLYILVFPSSSLPLDLVSFTAVPDVRNAKLNWSVVNQVNVDRFEIERASSPTAVFSSVGSITAGGSASRSYTYTDAQVGNLLAKAYYRLKMIDIDGQFKYSPVATVSFGKGTAMTIRPSLVTAGEAITLSVAAANQPSYTARIFNTAGHLVREWTAATGTNHQIETANLPKGVYMIQVTQETGVLMEKFVVR